MKIAWSVKVPKGAKLKIKNNSAVEAGSAIYEHHQNIVERYPLIGWQKLSSSDRKVVLQNVIKRDLAKDEIIKSRSFFSNITLKSPASGKCLGVDEFGNIEFETIKDEVYLAPISTGKVRVEEGKVIFVLRGNEYESEGVNQIKSWNNFSGLVVVDMDQVGNSVFGQVVVVNGSLDAATKAEAVGASGLILVDFDKFREFEDSDIPVVLMKESEVEKLIKFVEGREVKLWLNAMSGKVLAVIE